MTNPCFPWWWRWVSGWKVPQCCWGWTPPPPTGFGLPWRLLCRWSTQIQSVWTWHNVETHSEKGQRHFNPPLRHNDSSLITVWENPTKQNYSIAKLRDSIKMTVIKWITRNWKRKAITVPQNGFKMTTDTMNHMHTCTVQSRTTPDLSRLGAQTMARFLLCMLVM